MPAAAVPVTLRSARATRPAEFARLFVGGEDIRFVCCCLLNSAAENIDLGLDEGGADEHVDTQEVSAFLRKKKSLYN